MHNQYFPGNVVRNLPKNGKFEVFVVEGFVLDMLEVRSTAHKHIETEYWKPEDVELFQFTSSVGTYKIGDVVRLFGIDGHYEVLGFEAGEHDETWVKVSGFGLTLSWPAHYARPVGH